MSLRREATQKRPQFSMSFEGNAVASSELGIRKIEWSGIFAISGVLKKDAESNVCDFWKQLAGITEALGSWHSNAIEFIRFS